MNFGMIISPVVWQKLPLPGIGYIFESLKKNNIYCTLFDLNIQIYTIFKKEKKSLNWTREHQFFTEKFFKYTFERYHYLFINLIKKVKEKDIKHIGFSIYKTNFLFSLNLAKFLKQELPHIKIIFGGPHIQYLFYYNPKYFNQIQYVDCFIIGEGELSLNKILENKIKTKYYISPQIIDINKLNFPKYHEFNLNLYERKNSLPIIFNRGCINNCNFCFEKLQFKKFITREPENVIDEIKYHKKHNKISWFTFYDSMFNGNLYKMENLLKKIKKEKLNIIWDAQIGIRKEILDKKLLKLIKDSGCINLFIGIESGSDFILKKMNKNFQTNDAIKFFKLLNDVNLNFEISLIVNYPEENPCEFTNTKNFIIKNKKYINQIAQINQYIYYPGTQTNIIK